MGGTSFDVSLIAKGEAALCAQTSIDFGMVVRTPMIEITTIGAGGGSIAWIDKSGLLQVGPESAGSDPGPACYGLGNNQPTVTDANLVLGRINPQRPIGGKLASLDIEAARSAIDAVIGQPLGLDTEAAAEAVLTLANARMAGAIRLVSIEQGHDPADFLAMPFGGGGALHTGALIRETGLKGAIVPRYPGVTSALGCVVADMRHDRVQTVNRLLADTDTRALGQQMQAVAAECEQLLQAAEVEFSSLNTRFELDMLYLGQTHTVAVPLLLPQSGLQTEDVQSAFDASYASAFGRLLDNIPCRIMNFRVAVTGVRPTLEMSVFAPPAGAAPDEAPEHRDIYASGQRYRAGVYQRLDLPAGVVIDGPALLEQADATIFVDPGLQACVDANGNLLIAAGVRDLME